MPTLRRTKVALIASRAAVLDEATHRCVPDRRVVGVAGGTSRASASSLQPHGHSLFYPSRNAAIRSLPARDPSNRTARTELGNRGERQTTHLELLERGHRLRDFFSRSNHHGRNWHTADARSKSGRTPQRLVRMRRPPLEGADDAREAAGARARWRCASALVFAATALAASALAASALAASASSASARRRCSSAARSCAAAA